MSAVRVGLFEVEKDAFGCFSSKNCRRPGAEAEIVQLVLRILQIPYVIVDLRREYNIAYDFGRKLPNGSWTGVMNLLTENLIDICGLSMRITEERMKDVYFSYPTRYFKSIFVINKPSIICPRAFILNAFNPTTWLLIVSFMFFAYLFLIILHFCQEKFSKNKNIKKSMREATKHFIDFPESSAVFSLLSFSIILSFMIFVLSSIYQSKMYAYLASASNYHVPFYDLKGALDKIEDSSSFFTAFDTQSLLCSTEVLCKKMAKITKSGKIRRHSNQKDIEEDLDNGGIYQSTMDSSFVPHKVSWLDKSSVDRIIIRDDDASTYFVSFSFSSKNQKLRDRSENLEEKTTSEVYQKGEALLAEAAVAED